MKIRGYGRYEPNHQSEILRYVGVGRSRAGILNTTILQRRMGQSGMRGAGCPLERDDAWAVLSNQAEALAAVAVVMANLSRITTTTVALLIIMVIQGRLENRCDVCASVGD